MSVNVTAVTRMIMEMTRALRSSRSVISSQAGSGSGRRPPASPTLATNSS